jgi:antirestriction protein ArdC
MSRSSSSSSFDLYQTVTDQIVAMLDRGVVPWRSPILGKSSAGYPLNHDSGKRYRGVNVFLLAVTAWAKGYESAHWLTFNQAKANGGTVKKGEKSSMVVFWKPLKVTDKKTGEKKGAFVLRYYNVFNVQQCDGIAAPDAPAYTASEYSPVEAASAIVQGYVDGPAIHHRGGSAFYRPGSDEVTLPEPTRFASTNEYYSTLFHELAHSTGHSSRLARGLDTDLRPFGSPDYGKEELIAEMAAAFLCGASGIVPSVIDNQAAYLQGWLNVLKGDKRLVIAAAGQAQRAADWIMGERQPFASATQPTATPEPDTAETEPDSMGSTIPSGATAMTSESFSLPC